jgi:DNA-binding MarR family transcriptional regulator
MSNDEMQLTSMGTSTSTFGGSSSIALLDIVRVIERLHRRSLDLIRIELIQNGIDDVTPSQVMMMFTIGADEISVRDLIGRGYYLGTNASYSLKRLVEASYVDRTTSERDRRSARIRLSEKGHRLCKLIRSIDETYQQRAARDEEEVRELETTFRTLRRLEKVWSDALQFGSTPAD